MTGLAVLRVLLVAMSARVGEFDLTPNRMAALGLNVILLVNLAGSTWHTLRLVSGRQPAARRRAMWPRPSR